MNTTKIEEVVDPIAVEQFNALKTSGKELRTELIALLEVAIKLNSTLGGSTPASFTKNLKASTDATENIINNNNKIIDNEVKKAQKQEQIVNKYLILLSRQEAERQKIQAKQEVADAKEIANAERKAVKLQAISDRAEAERVRKANVQFPAGQSSPNPATMDDSPAIRYEPIITGQENMTSASAQSTAALAGETAAMVEQKEVLAALSVEQRANVELLLTLQAERAENAAELKILNAETAAGGERVVFLTAEQIKLNIAIRQTNATLAQQTKQMIAEDGSALKLNAQLAELRAMYDALSVEQRENIAVGGVLLVEIEKLDVATKELSAKQGIHNKNVGNYTTATMLADKVSAQFVRQLTRMAAQFLLITVIFGTISWLYDLIKNMDIFTGRLDQATQNLKALNEVQKDAAEQSGQIVGKFRILSDTVKDLTISYEDRLRAATELKRLFPVELEHSNAQAIANGTESASLEKLTDSVVKLARAKAAANQIEKVEGEIIALQIQRDKVNTAKASQIQRSDATAQKIANQPSTLGQFSAGSQVQDSGVAQRIRKEVIAKAKSDANEANKDIADQIGIKERTIKFLEQYGGLQPEAESIEAKPKKTPKTKDAANTELLEYYRLQLEETKKASKLILDNDDYSFAARRAALEVYLKASADLVNNAEQIALADKNISNQKRKNIELEFHNRLLDTQREGIIETEKLAKEELEKQKKYLADMVTASKESEQEQLETIDNASKLALRGLNKAKDDKENALNLQRAQGKISERKYNEELLAINDQFAIDRISQELTTQNAILAVKEGRRDAAVLTAKVNRATPEQIAKIQSEGDKDAQGTKDKVADLTDALGNAIAKKGVDETKSTAKDNEQDRKQIEQAGLEATIQGIDLVDSLRQKTYEKELKRLENQGKIIDENAQIAKDAVGRSLDTEKNKARELAIIDAQTASSHRVLQEKENQLKRKAAKADKEATIAKIIAQGALAVVTALTAPPGIAQVLAAISAGIIGIELAKAIAAPLPTYATGGTTRGGLVIYGEKGPEHVQLPSGETYYSPGVATIANLPKGTKITPHGMLPETPKWTQSRTDNSDVVAAIDRLSRKEQPRASKAKLSGWVEAQRQADAWNRYSTQHFK